MTDKPDNDFDYLDDAEIAQLYAQSKTRNVPDRLASTIKTKAREDNATGKPSSPNNAPKNTNWFLPLAMAASVVFAVLVYWAVLPQNTEQQVVERSTKQPDSQLVTNKNDAEQNPADEGPMVSHNRDGDTERAPTDTKGVAPEQDNSDQGTVTNSQLATSGQAPNHQQMQQIPDNKSENLADEITAKSVKENSINKATNTNNSNQGEQQIAGDSSGVEVSTDDEEPTDEDVDFSLDWMNRVAGDVDTDTATNTVSNTLTAKQWIKEITLLHRQEKYIAAKKEFVKFRKQYPHYQVPAELKKAYQPE